MRGGRRSEGGNGCGLPITIELPASPVRRCRRRRRHASHFCLSDVPAASTLPELATSRSVLLDGPASMLSGFASETVANPSYFSYTIATSLDISLRRFIASSARVFEEMPKRRMQIKTAGSKDSSAIESESWESAGRCVFIAFLEISSQSPDSLDYDHWYHPGLHSCSRFNC